jgi:LytS/YehU family sensor histidine kinase
MQVRLGERLAFSFDVPGELQDARIPPMLLLPLINHALVHGIAAEATSGTLSVTAHVAGGRLNVSVADTSGGLSASGDAPQLRNIRDRIGALYAEAGAFRVERIDAAGARAVLELPYEIADDDHR